MKLNQTRQAVDAYADGLQAAEAWQSSGGLRAIAALLGEFANEQMSTVASRARQAGRNAGRAGSSSPCFKAATQLDLLAKILVAGGAKKELTKDVTSVGNLLRLFGDSETLDGALEKLRSAMKPETIEQSISRFIKRLRDERGTALFDGAFVELASSRLKREHVVEVARSVYGDVSSKTSRKEALDYIRKPHDAFISAKRGINASGGRSAA